MSRGDGTLSDFLINVYKKGGKIGAFKSAAKDCIDAEFFALADYEFAMKLPWDFIEIKPGKDFLMQENKRLLDLQKVTL